MQTYLDLLKRILEDGTPCADRTGTGTIELFDDTTMVFDLNEGFPLMTTKKMAIKNIIRELLWFISGDTNAKTLSAQGCHIWDGNADPDTGELGPIYGKQWRAWDVYRTFQYSDHTGDSILTTHTVIDQIEALITDIREHPESRRLIVSAWNVADLNKMRLPPCHVLWQCHVRNGEYLDLKLYQRSADMFLGVPFNIASYSLLLMMLAQVTGLKPGKFIHVLGNAHIYSDHVDQVNEQLTRTPMRLPDMEINPDITDINKFTLDDFHLEGYTHHPAIYGKMSV